MLLNNLKINSKKTDARVIVSDNDKTYLTISDFESFNDGLWSYGVKLIKSIIPEEIDNKIISKTLGINNIQVYFTKKVYLNFYLFKNDKGLLVEINNKSFIDKDVREYEVNINIDNKFEIIEKNISNIILEYPLQKENSYGCKKIIIGILTDIDYDITNTKIADNSIGFCLNPQKTAKKSPYFYIVYDSDYKKLKEKIDTSPSMIFQLKEEQNKKSQNLLDALEFETEDKNFEKAINFTALSSDLFLMRKNDNNGLFAGYPWFDNYWGRDSFISIPGLLLVTGRYKEAFDAISLFYKHQCKKKTSEFYGRIPNVIFSKDEVQFNSSDATSLYIREIYEYFLYTSDYEKIIPLWDSITLAIEKVYLSKKDDNNLLKHDASETWMDTKNNNKHSYSQRGCYAVEIQALWYTALYCAINLGKFLIKYFNKTGKMNLIENILKNIEPYKIEAVKLKESINKYFIKNTTPYIADSLDKNYKIIEQIRPNGLLAIYFIYIFGIPEIFKKEIIGNYFKYIAKELIYEQGVSTISKNDKYFHPVHISDHYHKDASYHNGVIWNWLSGPFIHTACRLGLNNFAFKLTQNITQQIFESNIIGTLCEIVDVHNGKEKAAGAYSQAWSVGEFLRSLYQDYLGIRHNVPKRTLYIHPNIPLKLSIVKANIKYGFDENLSVYFRLNKKQKFISYLEIKGLKINLPIYICLKINLRDKIKRNKLFFIKFVIKKPKDLIRITFEYTGSKIVKIEDINTIGECSLLKVITKINSKEAFFRENIEYATSITDEQFENLETIKNNNLLENYIDNLYK